MEKRNPTLGKGKQMQTTLKATITFVHEYEADTNDYRVYTVEEMCKIDTEAINDDPGIIIGDAEMTVKVEEIIPQ